MLKEQRVKKRGHLFSWDTFGDCWLNIYLIKGRNRDYVIDSGLGSGSVECVKAHLDPDKEIVLINTHYHWDHVWGNAFLPKASVIAHTLCREMLMQEWDTMGEKYKRYQDGSVIKRLPDIVFENTLSFPEDRLRLFYSPGHTKDGISILDEHEGVLILGDNIGDNEEEIVPGLYDEKQVYIETLKTYQQLDFDTVISGHNDIMDKSIILKIMNLIA